MAWADIKSEFKNWYFLTQSQIKQFNFDTMQKLSLLNN